MAAVSRNELPKPARIVVLNGASSSGKSSLAKALQVTTAESYLHLQLDAFRGMEPPGYWEGVGQTTASFRLAALCRAMNATAAEFARHGQAVLLDHVLPPLGWRYLAEDLSEFEVLLVAVRCSRDVLEVREAMRGDRPSGLAASQSETVHAGRPYDFEIDTTRATPAECAAELAQWLGGAPVPKTYLEIERRGVAI